MPAIEFHPFLQNCGNPCALLCVQHIRPRFLVQLEALLQSPACLGLKASAPMLPKCCGQGLSEMCACGCDVHLHEVFCLYLLHL